MINKKRQKEQNCGDSAERKRISQRIILLIIITLFKSQIILAKHKCSTDWGDCKSNKSNQINQMKSIKSNQIWSNRPRASRSSDFEITRATSPWIVVHSVQLLLLIDDYESTRSLKRTMNEILKNAFMFYLRVKLGEQGRSLRKCRKNQVIRLPPIVHMHLVRLKFVTRETRLFWRSFAAALRTESLRVLFVMYPHST